MAKSQRLNLLLLVLGFFLVYWTTKPDDHISFDRSCNVVGLRAKFSEAIYGDAFWRIQLGLADEALGWLQRAPAADQRARESQDRNPVEERMTRLSDHQASTAEDRETVRAREQKERFEQIAWLSSCDALIRLKLKD